jgi:hypothetical protein
MTVQYSKPVRNTTPQQLGPYTFFDENNAVIDLTPYVSVSCQIKQQGVVYTTVAGTILFPPTAGMVEVSAYTFTSPGIWDVQFICVDGSGNLLPGEPIQVMVVPNVPDLALTQLPQY